MKKTLIIVVLLFIASSFCIADDMYAAFSKFDGIDGESDFQGQTGWISLQSVKIGPKNANGKIANPVITFTPGKITGPNAQSIGELRGMSVEIIKWVDISSSGFMLAYQKKIRIPDAKICICSAQDHKQVFYTILLLGGTILNVQQEGNLETTHIGNVKVELCISK